MKYKGKNIKKKKPIGGTTIVIAFNKNKNAPKDLLKPTKVVKKTAKKTANRN